MSLLIPQFVWPPLSPANTLLPAYPPIEKPAKDDAEAVKSRAISVSGKVQTWLWRTDIFKHLSFKFVPQADLDDWNLFLEYALEGASFLYYPDSLATAYEEWWLEGAGGSGRSDSNVTSDAAWNPNYSFRNVDEFELVLRKVPGGLSAP